jgi:hypothetical protein
MCKIGPRVKLPTLSAASADKDVEVFIQATICWSLRAVLVEIL